MKGKLTNWYLPARLPYPTHVFSWGREGEENVEETGNPVGINGPEMVEEKEPEEQDEEAGNSYANKIFPPALTQRAGEKAAEWTVVARRKKKVAARSTGEAKRGETKPTASPSGGGSGGFPDKETPSTAPPARQGGKAARKTKHLTPGGEEREAAGEWGKGRQGAHAMCLFVCP
ncbi:UNVERIFIED_CONTAM: hypothetical protein FKN15_062068 [Acipenser sinensis]